MTQIAEQLAAIKNHVVPAPDLLEIVSRSMPGQDGVQALYSIAGGVDFRIARLAAMVTNAMASKLVESGTNGIDSFNDALAAIAEEQAAREAFYMAGLDHKDMIADLKGLCGFRLAVHDAIVQITKKPYASRWVETITRAAEPREVEAWKLEDGWQEYLEACHGKPEMTKEEHYEMERAQLSGRKQNWGEYIPQIISTIERFGAADAIEFGDLPVQLQNSLLATMSTDEKKDAMRVNAKKLAKSPADLHAKRMMITDFIEGCREALTHSRFANVE